MIEQARDREWLMALGRQTPPALPRSRRYLEQILAADRPLDLSNPNPTPLDWRGAYHVSRGGSALIGRKAFLFRTPGTPLYHDPKVLADVLFGLDKFRASQHRRGDFIWGDAWSKWLPSHEHTWRTEPLLWARVWLDEFLSAKEKSWIDAMLHKAALWLYHFEIASPNDTVQYCNRGPVWLTGMTLCGLYFDERRFLKKVDHYADAVLRGLINERGEVLEGYLHYTGGGPDTGSYSYTGWVYALMYRLLSGRSDWDERMVQALRWFAQYTTRSGWPVASGASVRSPAANVLVEDLLSGYEFFADREPQFWDIAGRYIGVGAKHGQGHCVHPCIWALFSHKPRPAAASKAEPAWFSRFEGHYDHQSCQYSLWAQRYQTGVTWRSLYPLKGLQTFALGNEQPIVHHTVKLASTTRSGKVDTARDNVAAGKNGWEIFRRAAGPGNGYEPAAPATWITTRRGSLWECYVFTRESVVYVAGTSGRAGIHCQWVLHGERDSVATLEKRKRLVHFAGRQGCIRYLASRATLAAVQGVQMLQLKAASGPIITALGGLDLGNVTLDRRGKRLRFQDASGRYTVELAGIIGEDGHLDRNSWDRVVKA